jgi:hypothetical protein
VLKRCGVSGLLRNGKHLFASSLRLQGRRLSVSFPHSAEPCEHGCATCKPTVMRRLGAGRQPIIFIGDGLSDRFAVEAADMVFAKRQLLAYCHEQGFVCQAFETFADVQKGLETLLRRSAAGHPRLKVEGRKSRAGIANRRVPVFNI